MLTLDGGGAGYKSFLVLLPTHPSSFCQFPNFSNRLFQKVIFVVCSVR